MKKIYLCKNNIIDGWGRATCKHLKYSSSVALVYEGEKIYSQCEECPHFDRNNQMRSVRVSYSNNNTITTNINGTDEEIREYYKIGRLFNLGSVNDDMQAVEAVEFLDD